MATQAELPVTIPFEGNSTPAPILTIPAKSGFKIRILHYTISAASAVIAKFITDGPTDLTGGLHLGPAAISATAFGNVGLFETGLDGKVEIVLSGGVNTGGHLTYQYVPAK